MHMPEFGLDADQKTLDPQYRRQINVLEIGICKLTFRQEADIPSPALYPERKLEILQFLLLVYLGDIWSPCKTQIQMVLDLDNRV